MRYNEETSLGGVAMPWSMEDHPSAYKNLDRTIKKKAIDIANGLLANGYEDDEAIPISISQAKEWAANASKEEQQAVKYGKKPRKEDSHEQQTNPDLLDNDVLVYFEEEKWLVKTKDAKQAADTFNTKEEALKRAKEIADNKDTSVIQYTKDGKKQN